MQVKFGNTTKRKNSTLVPSVTGDLGDCLLKSPVSIVTPTFEVYSEAYPDYNYCYVPEFHRYYFITDIVSTSAGQWDISCLVDVLATYKTGVLNTTAFVERSQSLYDPSIPDPEIATSMRFEVINTGQTLMPGMDNENGCYVVSIAGLSGGQYPFVNPFLATQSEMVSIANNFFNDSKMAELKEKLANPMDCLVKCIWVPFDKAKMSSGVAEGVFAGNVDLDLTLPIARKVYNSHLDLEIECPYFSENPVTHERNYSDYRNCAPYTTTELLLPGVGLIELPTNDMLGSGANNIRIMLDYYLSPINGDIMYIIQDYNNSTFQMIVEGNCAVDMPLAATSSNYIAKQQAVISALGAGVTAIAGTGLMLSGNPYGLAMLGGAGIQAANAAGAYQSANQHHTTVSGALGGFASNLLNIGCTVFQKRHILSGSASAIGRPYYNTAKLSSFTGYVKCKGAYVGVNATDTEHNMLMALINGGFYVE